MSITIVFSSCSDDPIETVHEKIPISNPNTILFENSNHTLIPRAAPDYLYDVHIFAAFSSTSFENNETIVSTLE